MRNCIKRREFITLLGGAAAAWPLAARAQQPAGRQVPRVGIIDDDSRWEPFRQALRERGYIDGRTIIFEYRTAGGDSERLKAVANELARLPVALIATYGTLASQAAKLATYTIPIVMVGIGDPVGAGLVPSLARPGGNITGNTILGPEVGAKRLQLLKEAVPTASHVAMLWNPDNASNRLYLEELQVAAPALGVTLRSMPVRNVNDLDNAFATMRRERPNAFNMTADPFHLLHLGRITDFLNEMRMPGMFGLRENVVAGGLMSYGASLPDLFRRSADYAHRILQGTKPADLPVEAPTRFELVVNLKTAKALGLTISESFLLRADEVIE